MSIEKSLIPAPAGLGSLSQEEPINIIIVGPDDVEVKVEEKESKFGENLAETLDPGELHSLGSTLLALYDADLQSRRDWLDTYVKGLKLLGLNYQNMTEPWAGACGVFHPLLMESAVKFQAETIMEIFPSAGPVRTKILGKETPEKKEASIRVEEDMNYELTEVMPEYRPEFERLLISLCLSGNGFKKIYFDPALNRQVANFVGAEDIIVPYGAPNLESAERITHRMRKTKNELRKMQVAGFYRDTELGEPMVVMDEVDRQKAMDQGNANYSAIVDKRFQLLEMHVNLDLDADPYHDKDGIELPYVVTIEKGTNTVLSIRRNWLEEDKLKARRQHFVHYGYIPGFGFYYFGLIHLIGGHATSATSLLRQLVDAGVLANLPGGLKARGLRVKEDDTPIEPGEWRDVDIPGGTIKDNIFPLPYKEPSQTLLALMNQIVEDGRRFAAVADLKVSDMSAQSPVGTTLAILERVLKVMSAVQARIHYAMKQEFKLLAGIIRDNTPEDYDYEPESGDPSAKRADYDCCEVIPVSDPNASTMSQRVVQYQAVLQLSATAPQIYDLPFLHRQMIETLGVKNVQKIIPLKEDMKPVDPVSENMAIMMGKPVKAFIYQDHEAHLAVHMAAMQDPKIQQVVGQNPQAPLLMGAAHAHIMEHVAFQYRREIEKQLGASLPPPPSFDPESDDDETGYLPPAIEAQLSTLAAQAAGKLLKKDQQEMAAQAAQQAAQDPLIQMQQQELQLKAQEVQIKKQDSDTKAQLAKLQAQIQQMEQDRKAKKDLADASAKADDLALRQKELEADMHLEGVKLGSEIADRHKQTTLKAAQAADQQALQEKQHSLEGVKLGVDISKHHMDQIEEARKHHEEQRNQLRMHKADLHTEMHTQRADHEVDLHKHHTGLEHEQDQAELDRKHEMAKEEEKTKQAKLKPKPKPTGDKK